MARMLTEQMSACLIGNHSFVQFGDTWIDVDALRMPDAPRVRVRFDSREYFDVIARIPKALPWVLQARNIQFLHNGTIYEIYE